MLSSPNPGGSCCGIQPNNTLSLLLLARHSHSFISRSFSLSFSYFHIRSSVSTSLSFPKPIINVATFAFMMPFFRLSAIFLAVVAICVSSARAAPLSLDHHEARHVAAARGVAAGPYAGDLTFYYPGGNYGSCGTPLQNGDKVVALAAAFFDQCESIHS